MTFVITNQEALSLKQNGSSIGSLLIDLFASNFLSHMDSFEVLLILNEYWRDLILNSCIFPLILTEILPSIPIFQEYISNMTKEMKIPICINQQYKQTQYEYSLKLVGILKVKSCMNKTKRLCLQKSFLIFCICSWKFHYLLFRFVKIKHS